MTNLTIDEALPVEDKKEHSGRAKAAEMDAIVNSQDRQTEVGQEEDRRKQKAESSSGSASRDNNGLSFLEIILCDGRM